MFSFRKLVPSRYPKDVKLYLVMDNLNLHKTEEIVRWAKQSRVELVWPALMLPGRTGLNPTLRL